MIIAVIIKTLPTMTIARIFIEPPEGSTSSSFASKWTLTEVVKGPYENICDFDSVIGSIACLRIEVILKVVAFLILLDDSLIAWCRH